MDELERVPSSVFRLTYAGLEQPVTVTRDGRTLGVYIPISAGIDLRFLSGLRPGEPPSGSVVSATSSTPQVDANVSRDPLAHPGTSTTGAMSQADRDKVLRKVAKGR